MDLRKKANQAEHDKQALRRIIDSTETGMSKGDYAGVLAHRTGIDRLTCLDVLEEYEQWQDKIIKSFSKTLANDNSACYNKK